MICFMNEHLCGTSSGQHWLTDGAVASPVRGLDGEVILGSTLEAAHGAGGL